MNAKWQQNLKMVFRTGEMFHDRQLFELFLGLVGEGGFDGSKSESSSFWSCMYGVASKKPEWACEALGRWFDRMSRRPATDLGRDFLEEAGDGSHIIEMARHSSVAFVREFLPRVASLVNSTAKEEPDRLMKDPIWHFRSYGDSDLNMRDTILSSLAIAMESLAIEAPSDLDNLLDPVVERPHDTVAFLALRAWTASPTNYATRIVNYLATDSRRLKIGYATWGGEGGNAANFVSSSAVKAATEVCDDELAKCLESAILALTDAFEISHPRYIGLRQLDLLLAFKASRLSPPGRRVLGELQRKFPSVSGEKPEPMTVDYVGPPIDEQGIEKMADENWLQAMRKYQGKDERINVAIRHSGGEAQLSRALEEKTKKDPIRFVNLGLVMSTDLAPAYFGAILRGVAGADAKAPAVSVGNVSELILRAHSLPGRPCGSDIGWLLDKKSEWDWPSGVLDAIAWYALHDPDPRPTLTIDMPGDNRDIHSDGLNSTRGFSALAIASLISSDPEREAVLHSAVMGLTFDAAVSVRSCALSALGSLFSVDPDTAISWFVGSVRDELFDAPHFDWFMNRACHHDYAAVRGVLQRMLRSETAKTIESAAALICIGDFSSESARDDATAVRTGSKDMRRGAADVYARHVDRAEIGAVSRMWTCTFLNDPDPSVREVATKSFDRIGRVPTEGQAELLEALLKGKPSKEDLADVLRTLEASPLQLPDLVCRVAEVCMATHGQDASNMESASFAVGRDLSKVVIRLYSQTEDPKIKSRCLALIDDMERFNIWGVDEELRTLDR